jgi:hypothetical protein
MKDGWRLTEDQVQERMSSYLEPEVTEALYGFGTILIAANRERTKTLEGKAMTVAAYGLAILAFLASREPSGSVLGPWPPGWVALASVFAAVALVCISAALLIRGHAWLSDSQWFENRENVLENADSLKRCHVLAMHAVNRRMKQSNDLKANLVLGGQLLIAAAGICLALWVVFR